MAFSISPLAVHNSPSVASDSASAPALHGLSNWYPYTFFKIFDLHLCLPPSFSNIGFGLILCYSSPVCPLRVLSVSFTSIFALWRFLKSFSLNMSQQIKISSTVDMIRTSSFCHQLKIKVCCELWLTAEEFIRVTVVYSDSPGFSSWFRFNFCCTRLYLCFLPMFVSMVNY